MILLPSGGEGGPEGRMRGMARFVRFQPWICGLLPTCRSSVMLRMIPSPPGGKGCGEDERPAMFQTPARTRQARRLRADMTGAEAHLWAMLRGRRCEGLKFRRQEPVAGAIPDFVCPEIKLLIELDGGVHDLRVVEDAERDLRLAEAGFTVLRFGNEAFLRNPGIVLEAIRRHAAERRRA